MQFTHQITLPRDVWDEFQRRLANVDVDKQERIDAFLAEIERDISVRHDDSSIWVDSKNIDESAIIAKLENRVDEAEVYYECVQNYHISTSSILDTLSIREFVERNAREDGYQDLLNVHLKISAEYYSMDVRDYSKSA